MLANDLRNSTFGNEMLNGNSLEMQRVDLLPVTTERNGIAGQIVSYTIITGMVATVLFSLVQDFKYLKTE